jgi:hypothetical protein
MRFVLLMSAVVQACFGSAVYQDSLLTLGNYTVFQKASPGVTETIANTSMGNPSNGLVVTDVFAAGPLNSTYAFINPSFAYNPAVMGALGSISASIDVRIDVAIGQLFGSGWDFFIEQGPNLYYHDFGAPGVTGVFQTVGGSGLQAADFVLFNFANGTTNSGAHPDFAQPLDFGFGSLNGFSYPGPGTNTANLYYDNLSITASSVPEPNTVGLVAFALIGLAAFGKGRGARGERRQ